MQSVTEPGKNMSVACWPSCCQQNVL